MNGKIEMWVNGEPIDTRTLCYVNPGFPEPVQSDRPCCKEWRNANDLTTLNTYIPGIEYGDPPKLTCDGCYFFHGDGDD